VSTEHVPQAPPPPTRFPRSPAHRTWSWPVVGAFLITAGAVLHLSVMLPHFMPRFVDPNVAIVRVLHGSFGVLTMVTALVQLWPGMRRRFPRLHRWNGRVYVFGGVLPCSILLVGVLFSIGEPTNTAQFFWGMVWLAATAVGWRAGRRRHFAKHRQWMSYSIALTLVIPMNAGVVMATPYVAPLVSPAVVFDSLQWLTWVLHLAVAHWYVSRGEGAAPRAVTPLRVHSTATKGRAGRGRQGPSVDHGNSYAA
jgi:hypothetical protein